MKLKKWLAYDTTLRDGLQENGREITLSDAKKFARKLDDMGFAWLEAGFASAGADQMKRIKTLASLPYKNLTVTAFGRTRGKKETPETAIDLKAILESGVETGTVVGKSRKRDVFNSLQTTPENNFKMISDSIKYLRDKGLKVIFDAEHFFDGLVDDQNYTLKTIKAAHKAGADWIVLCDTNGGSTLNFIRKGIKLASEVVPLKQLGFHGHNDRGRSVVLTETAFLAGVNHLQGTVNGYGERCGNADFCQLIPNLATEYNSFGIFEDKLKDLTILSESTAEYVNAQHRSNHPWVGSLAGHTEAGMHASGMLRDPSSYIHADLKKVGNKVSFGVSEQSGKSNIATKTKELGLNLNAEEIGQVSSFHDKMIREGYIYSGADASFYLLVMKALKTSRDKLLKTNSWKVVTTADGKKLQTKSTVNASLKNQETEKSALGNGPVDAMCNALTKILESFGKNDTVFKINDYRVKVIPSGASSAAKVRVLIESSNEKETWTTVGVDENIINASWLAIEDSVNYSLLKN